MGLLLGRQPGCPDAVTCLRTMQLVSSNITLCNGSGIQRLQMYDMKMYDIAINLMDGNVIHFDDI
jgi:hypothetical protein